MEQEKRRSFTNAMASMNEDKKLLELLAQESVMKDQMDEVDAAIAAKLEGLAKGSSAHADDIEDDVFWQEEMKQVHFQFGTNSISRWAGLFSEDARVWGRDFGPQNT